MQMFAPTPEEERLAAIFLKGGRNAFEQARAVMDEGARYNIGNINRNINTPTLPLAFMMLNTVAT